MMTVISLYLLAAAAVGTMVLSLWVISVLVRDASIIDMFWGLLFVVVAWLLLAHAEPVAARPELPPQPLLVVALVTVWGLRLSFHLFQRNFGRGEDARYRRWRRAGGAWWWLKSLWQVYLLQGAVALVVAAPIVAIHAHPGGATLGVLDWLGVGLWMLGFGFELFGDLQLERFRAESDNRGRVLARGLWRYTRHPNYFGDAAQWWGIGLIAVSFGNLWSLIGPLVMTAVLVRISGALLERGMRHTREGYDAYAARTSAFIPWPPRRHPVPPREGGAAIAANRRDVADSDAPGRPG